MEKILIRLATPEDHTAIADVMFDAIRNGNSAYSEVQRQAWVPHRRSGAQWEQRLLSQNIFVAVDAKQMSGFMSLDDNGYIDFAYIRPSAQGRGIFSRLFSQIEGLAYRLKKNRLWVHASLKAEPAFSSKGFEIMKKETVEIGDQSFERFEMEKHLEICND